MHIVHVASEFAPIAKVGGLADVITGLSKALVKLDHQVTIFLPKYDCMDCSTLDNLHVLVDNFPVMESNTSIPSSLWLANYEGLTLILVEPHHPKAYFQRGKIYGEEDDNDRFLFFCKVVSTYLRKSPPEVVHLHDWPSAACSLFLKNTLRTVFTIHNLQYQGRCAPFNLQRIGLSFEESHLRDTEYNEAANLLRGAIHSSHVLTTVSPTYMKEILTTEGGCGLEGDLQKNKKKLRGILNGIDVEYWNPATDPFLAQKYTQETRVEGKKINKLHVQKKLGLPEEDKPLVIAVTRLTPQKGPDLIHYGVEKTIELGGQFVLLGSSSDPEIQEEFAELSSHPDIHIDFTYNESLAHLLYAAGDMFLMPSIFEPCGLAQMIAMRYGCVPLVRATGGLKDTVFDGENGYTFDIPDNKGVESVLKKSFSAYRTEQWQTLIQAGMGGNYTWETSAQKYIEIYSLKKLFR